MPRARSPNRDKAKDIYIESAGSITNREIASILDEDERVIAVWKSRDKWEDKSNVVQQSNESCTTKKKGGAPAKNKNAFGHGAPKENKNAVSHGAPVENQNARIHGLFAKYIPKDSLEIINAIDDIKPFDILWHQIKISYASILTAQKIMHVTDKGEMIKEIKKKKWNATDTSEGEETEWEFQFAWDRQATFLQAQAKAQAELRNLIKQYDEMLHKNWDLATEEQKTRVDLMKAQVDKISGNSNQDEIVEDWLDEVIDEGADEKRKTKGGF